MKQRFTYTGIVASTDIEVSSPIPLTGNWSDSVATGVVEAIYHLNQSFEEHLNLEIKKVVIVL